jgi:hypothetical protein
MISINIRSYVSHASFLILLSLISSFSLSQNKLVFNIQLGKVGTDYLVSRGQREARDLEALRDYFIEDYNSIVVLTDEQRNSVFGNVESICNIIDVAWNVGSFKSDLIAIGRYPMVLEFKLCDGTILKYSFPIHVSGYTIDFKNAILRALRANISKKELFKKITSVNLIRNISTVNKDTLELLVNRQPTDNTSIEGVYKKISTTSFTSLDRIAIFRIDNKLTLINLENSAFRNDWEKGEILGYLESTASNKYFICEYKGIDNKVIDISLLYSDNILEITFTDTGDKRSFVRVK